MLGSVPRSPGRAVKARIRVAAGPSSGGGRTMVIWEKGDGTISQLAEVDECAGNARGVKVHLMGALIGSHAGWRYKPTWNEGIDYVLSMHRRHGGLPTGLETFFDV